MNPLNELVLMDKLGELWIRAVVATPTNTIFWYIYGGVSFYMKKCPAHENFFKRRGFEVLSEL
jgi:hypothetical protein